MQPYRSAHTHYIYKYKRREAAGVGGHAVQEITTRGHPAQTRMRSKKDHAAHACPSVCFACHGSGGDGHDKDTSSHASRPRLCLVAAHNPDPPDLSRLPPSRPGSDWWQLRSTTTAPPEPYRAHPRPPTALPGWQLRSTARPRITPNNTPKNRPKCPPRGHPVPRGGHIAPIHPPQGSGCGVQRGGWSTP